VLPAAIAEGVRQWQRLRALTAPASGGTRPYTHDASRGRAIDPSGSTRPLRSLCARAVRSAHTPPCSSPRSKRSSKRGSAPTVLPAVPVAAAGALLRQSDTANAAGRGSDDRRSPLSRCSDGDRLGRSCRHQRGLLSQPPVTAPAVPRAQRICAHAAGHACRVASSLWKASAWMTAAHRCGVGARPSRRDADRYDHKAPIDRMGYVGAIHLPPVLTVRPHHGRRRAAAGHDAEADRVD